MPARSSASLGIMLPRDLPASRVRDFAVEADRLGFDELWVVEDLGFRGGVAQAALALSVTSRIRVGIGLLPAGARNVAFAAMEAATLAELFPGRLDVTIGHGMPGWMRSAGAWPSSPLGLLEEYTDAFRALLAGGSVGRDGRYVRLQDLRLESAPAVPPGILLGVRGPKSLALSGRVADGTVLAEPVTPEYVAASRTAIGAEDHRIVAYNVASIDPDRDVALARVRPALEWIGEEDWRPHIEPMPFAEEFRSLRAASASRADFAEALPEEWVRRLSVVGTVADGHRRLAELAEAGVTTNVLIPTGDPFESLAALATLAR